MKEDKLKGSNSALAPEDQAEELLSGRRLPFKGQDLSDYVSFWLTEKEGQYAKLTVDSYRHALSQFVAFWDLHKRPGLNSLFIRQYARELDRFRKLSPATVQAFLSALRSFFSWGVEQGWLLNNPAVQVKLPKISRRYRRDSLTHEESEELLGTVEQVKDVRGLRDYLLVALAVRIGLRESEMHLANVGDYSRRGAIGILYLKRKGRRAKDLSVVLVKDLADSMDLYLRLRGKQKATDCLFFSERPDRKGARLSVRGIRSILSSYMKTAGIDRPHVTPHSARHHAATNALANGASLKDVQEMLGHATIATTENYIHLAKRLNDGAEHRVQIGKKADLSAVSLVGDKE
jgi:site-specific recombinase XerD